MKFSLAFRIVAVLLLLFTAFLAVYKHSQIEHQSAAPHSPVQPQAAHDNPGDATDHTRRAANPPVSISKSPSIRSVPTETWQASLYALAAAALASFLVCYLIVRFEHLHARFSHDHTEGGPQKFHARPTPRIGGIALLAGLLTAWATLTQSSIPQSTALTPESSIGLLLLAALPAFAGGLTEDLTKRVGVMERLIMTMLSAGLAAWLLCAILPRLQIPGFDEALKWLPFAVAFTIFAVGGVANAINIIDGYNGLAPGYAIITLAAIAWVAAQVGDDVIFSGSLAMLGALVGYFFWNWPSGRIFLGDGGAYLLGFWLAELAVLLVVRNPDISPRLLLALMIYPVFETVFSIYRRKVIKRQSPGLPDSLHMHQLVYKSHTAGLSDTDDAAQIVARNSRVAPFFWLGTAITALITLYFWKRAGGLAFVIMGYCMTYVWFYFHLLTKSNSRSGNN